MIIIRGGKQNGIKTSRLQLKRENFWAVSSITANVFLLSVFISILLYLRNYFAFQDISTHLEFLVEKETIKFNLFT